jgi:tetratricopeptide (TPR) repeat protein
VVERRGLHCAATIVLSILLGACSRTEKPAEPVTPPKTTAVQVPFVLTPGLVAENNRGVALMGQFNYQAAFDLYRKLVMQQPNWLDAKINLAIAQLNLNRPGSDDLTAADRLLQRVLAVEPHNLRAEYCRAILLFNGSNPAAALEYFQAVAKADPKDAYAAYYTARCLFEAEKFADALSWYRAAIAIDPFLQSAYYGAFQTLQRSGDVKGAQEMLATFQRLATNPQAKKVDIKYTLMGPKAAAMTVDLQPPPHPERPKGPLFEAQIPLPLTAPLPEGVTWADADPRPPTPSITVCDIDGDGRPDLFIAGGLMRDGKRMNAVLLRRDKGYELELKHPLANISDVNAVLWGDYDNDGLTDVYFCRRGGNQLWRQSPKGKWQDVTASTKTAGESQNTVDGAMFDADQDGDLDLLLINADGPNELLINNLDGTFRPIAKARHIAGDGRPSRGVVVGPLDNNRIADIVVLHDKPPNEVYRNDRLWSYDQPKGWDAFRAEAISAAVAFDPRADGQMKLLALGVQGTLESWSPHEKHDWTVERFTPAELRSVGPMQTPHAQLAVADVSGDGRLAVIATDEHGWYASELSSEKPLYYEAKENDLLNWSLLNDDPAKGPAIVGFVAGKGPVIWQPGSGRFNFLSVQFTGRHEQNTQLKTNASGIGVTGAVRVDSHWTAISTYRPQSGPGQSLQPTAVGLGGHKQADFLSLNWPDGVFETTLGLAEGKLHVIEEKNRIPSSCPLLFVWNGRTYQFVADLLGVAGVGYAIGPGQYAPVRPQEHFLIPPEMLVPHNGRFDLQLAEPMEEITWLDSAALVEYDLPPGWQMTLDERLGVEKPDPTGEPRFFRDELLPAKAVNDRGQGVTELVSKADLRPAPPGKPDPHFIGRNAEHWIELEFDKPLDAHAGKPILIADGWIEFPYSQTMFAAWQAGAAYHAPTIEARDAAGAWQKILPEVGYPDGMPRQISVPLDHLPAGCRALRVRTNMEIYWDRFSVAWSEPCPQAKRRPLELASAELHRFGFPERIVGPERQTTFNYDHRPPIDDVRYLTGYYTRFGHIEELVSRTDDAVATIGPGEAAQLQFDTTTDAIPPGWTRRFVLEVNGWCKDTDLFTKDGETVEPIPHRDNSTPADLARRDKLHRKYNTRLEAGR